MKTILIADDHEIIRLGVRMLIESLPRNYNVIEAATCLEIMQVLSRKQTDYAILDVFLADGNILSYMKKIARYCQQTSILVYSGVSEKIYAKRFLKRGIRGLVSKHSPLEELEKAIRCFLDGEIYLSKSIKENLLKPSRIGENPFDSLSDRELQVAEYVAMGVGVQEIAQKMRLDALTICTYRRSAFEKLNIENVIELEGKFQLSRNGASS
jgi:two-component system, NarL family, invasion response regulator UvrY